MKENERNEILKMAQRSFFEAMKVGWAAGTKAVSVPDMPGYKEIPMFKHGAFSILDRYCVSDRGSAGTITIWYIDKTVWFMSYGGHYHKSDIPFLKRALMESYKHYQFNGGRGPKFHRGPTSIYSNELEDSSSFSGFKGKERIYGRDEYDKSFHLGDATTGQHFYWGMALI